MALYLSINGRDFVGNPAICAILYLHDALFELIIANYRLVLHSRFVGIDGIHRIIQEMGDTVGIRYTQTYEGEDSHFLSEYFLIPQRFAVLFLKEGIILIHKIREETKEGLIKITIHILSFLKQRGGRQGTDDVIILASNHLTLYRLIQFLQLFDIICAGIKRLADILS